MLKQSEFAVTKQMYCSKFEQIFPEKFNENFRAIFLKTRAGDRLGLEMSMKPNGIMNFAVLIDFVPRGIAGP